MAARERRSALRRVWLPRLAGLAFVLLCGGALASALSAGCSGWDPTRPFERSSPEVEEALRLIDAGQFESAEQILGKYLGTGVCADGGIAFPEAARERPNGSFDLGLVLFHIAEKYGRPFGEEEEGDPNAEDPNAASRSLEIDCALVVVKAIAADPKVPVELRARARYLAGNLEFLRRRYEEAVKEYDEALGLVPGIPDDAGGDGIGRDAAWNRAIALRRIQDQKDAGPDADADSDAPDSDDADAPDSPDGDDAADGDDGGDDGGDGGDEPDSGDAGPNEPDSGQDGGPDSGDDGGPPDAGQDAGDGGKPEDRPQDQPDPNEPDRDQPQPPQPATPDRRQDDRILEELEEAPSYQEEEAKKRAAGRRRVRMEDK